MVSIGKLMHAEQVVRYMVEATTDTRAAYYTTRDDTAGRWTGRAAEWLQLCGEVSGEQLTSLLHGRNPHSGAELMQRRWASQSIVAFDVTFSVPKSVSLLWAIGEESTRAAVLRAHQAAVDAVCTYLETHAGWGRRYDADEGDVVPVRADLVLPQFLHTTSRPVTDSQTGIVRVDPQLHSHVPIPNFVLRDDRTWGQLHSPALYRHAASAGAVGQAVLRHELVRELGVAVDVSRNGSFEVRGISRAMRMEFSRRSHQVAAMDRAFGVDSWHGHKLAVLASRESKHELDRSTDLFGEWRERAATVGLDSELVGTLLHQRDLGPEVSLTPEQVRGIVGERGGTAEAATFARRDLIRALASSAPQGATLAHLEQTADQVLGDECQVVPLGELSAAAAAELPSSFHAYLAEDRRYSTPEMLALERRMLATAHAGRLAGRGLAATDAVERAIAARPDLTGEQQTMIHAVCRRGEAVSLVEGSAGSGKTRALAACREALEASGHEVVGAALSARAARKLSEEAGIATSTVHGLLHKLEAGSLSVADVIVVDEAAMVGSRQVAKLVEYADRDAVKLVLVGDPHQLQPIDGGAAMRALQERLGCVTLSGNVRQAEPWERSALANLRDGDVAAAISAYRDHQAIIAVPAIKGDELRIRLLLDYQESLAAGRDTLMLAHRRSDVAFLNARAHDVADRDGRLEGPALTVGSHRVDGRGEVIARPVELRAGDIALCTANDHELGLANGMRVTVTRVDPEQHVVTLRTPEHREVSVDVRDYDALEHGYAMTVHRAQGITADVALVLANGDEGREWTYTAMSRGRERNVYYTTGAEPTIDEHGKLVWDESEERVTERLTRAWGRSRAADSTLDYERAQERLLDREHTRTPWHDSEPAYAPTYDTEWTTPSTAPSLAP